MEFNKIVKSWADFTYTESLELLEKEDLNDFENFDFIKNVLLNTSNWTHIQNQQIDGKSCQNLPIITENNSQVVNMTETFHESVEYLMSKNKMQFLPIYYILDTIFKMNQMIMNKNSDLKNFYNKYSKKIKNQEDWPNILDQCDFKVKNSIMNGVEKISGGFGRAYRSFPSFLRDLHVHLVFKELIKKKFTDYQKEYTYEIVQNPELDKKQHVDVQVKITRKNDKKNMVIFNIWLYVIDARNSEIRAMSKIYSEPGKISSGYNILAPIFLSDAKDIVDRTLKIETHQQKVAALIKEGKKTSRYEKYILEHRDKIKNIEDNPEYLDFIEDVIDFKYWILYSTNYVQEMVDKILSMLSKIIKGEKMDIMKYDNFRKKFEYPFKIVKTKLFTFDK